VDEIQKVLIKQGRKDLAQMYYLKLSGVFNSDEALSRYLREHPKSKPEKHKVKQPKEEEKSKSFGEVKEINTLVDLANELKIKSKAEITQKVKETMADILLEIVITIKKIKRNFELMGNF